MIKTIICDSAFIFKPCFDFSHDTETSFCRSRNESYAAVNLKQFFAATVKSVFSPKYQLITWVTLYQVGELQKGPKLMPY